MLPLAAVHVIKGTACLTVGLLHLLVGLQKEERRIDRLFSVMAICMTLRIYLGIFMYRPGGRA